MSPQKVKETLDREFGPAHIHPGAKDFNCHVEEKDTADLSLLGLPLHHRSSINQTSENESKISLQLWVGCEYMGSVSGELLWVGKCVTRAKNAVSKSLGAIK